MKIIYIIILLIFVLGACKSDTKKNLVKTEAKINTDSTIQNKVLAKIDSTINNSAYDNYDSCDLYWLRRTKYIEPQQINDTLTKLFNGKIALTDLNKKLILFNHEISYSYQLKLLKFKIYGYSSGEYYIRNILIPYSNRKTLEGLTELSKNVFIIPYCSDIECSSHILTIWKLESDSLEFVGHYRNMFMAEYSGIETKEVINVNGEKYIVGECIGGEGGDWWESIWVGKVIDDYLDVTYLKGTNYSLGSGPITKISYKVLGNKIVEYENKFGGRNQDSLISIKKNDTYILK